MGTKGLKNLKLCDFVLDKFLKIIALKEAPKIFHVKWLTTAPCARGGEGE